MLGYSLTVMGVILYSEAKKRSKWGITKGMQWLWSLVFCVYIARIAATFLVASLGYIQAVGVVILPSYKFYIFLFPGSLRGSGFQFVSATTAGLEKKCRKKIPIKLKVTDLSLYYSQHGVVEGNIVLRLWFFQERICRIGYLYIQSVINICHID